MVCVPDSIIIATEGNLFLSFPAKLADFRRKNNYLRNSKESASDESYPDG